MPKNILTGKVVSNKMDKTAIVSLESVIAHRLYGKTQKKTKKYKFHDEKNECKVGDLVEVEESRPYSKEKTWRLVRIIEKAGDDL